MCVCVMCVCVCVYDCACLCVHRTSSSWEVCGIRSIFKRNKVGLNSVFFSLIGCLTKAKRIPSALLLTHNLEEKKWNHVFPKNISTK